MSRYISVGIDIGSHVTRVAIAETGKKKTGFRIIGSGEAASGGIKHGYIVNQHETIESVRNAIAIAEKQANTRVRSALVSIGGIGLESHTAGGSIIVSRVDGQITNADVDKAIEVSEKSLQMLNKRIVHRFPLSFTVDGKKVLGHPEGMHGMKLEVETLFITAIDQHLDKLINTIEQAGVDVEDIVAAPLAASVVTLNKAQRTAGCVLANIGAETVSLGVFEDDYLISLGVLPIGSTDITNDIALGLRIPLDEAEQIKCTHLPHEDAIGRGDSHKELCTIIDARLVDIFGMIQTHLKKIGKSELLPAGVIITGGGSGIATIEDIAKESLRIPARVMMTPEGEPQPHTTWSVPYGLCLLGMDNTYQSDFLGLQSTRTGDHFRKFITWTKQFLP